MLQNSHSVLLSQQTDKNKPPFPKKSSENFPKLANKWSSMTDSLVTKQRLEAKQLLFYSQLFQQHLAWPWLFELSASHLPVWTTTRPPSTASLHSLCSLPPPDWARSLLCGELSTDSCSDSVPCVCRDQWPIFAFFIINHLGQGALSICSAEGTACCQGFLCTKDRKAVNECSINYF